MSPEQMAALGLTRDPAETGLVHDVYARSAGGPYYLTADEWRAVKRRMRLRERRQAAVSDSGRGDVTRLRERGTAA